MIPNDVPDGDMSVKTQRVSVRALRACEQHSGIMMMSNGSGNRAGRLVMNRLVLPGRLRVWIGAEI